MNVAFEPVACVVQDLAAAGLSFLLPFLDTWKGFTVEDPGLSRAGERNVEIYLQRWPADKKVGYFLGDRLTHIRPPDLGYDTN